MLAGVPPFDGESAQSILMKQATATPVPIQQHRSEIPSTLAELVDRTLAKDPADRFQTAEELSQALVDALPTAAQDSVRMRSPFLSGALHALVGLGVVAGLLLLTLTVLSKPPRLSARAPIPESLAQPLRRQGALAPGDAALYVFSPRGADDTTLLLVARRSVAAVTPHRVRASRAASVLFGYWDGRPGLHRRARSRTRDSSGAASGPCRGARADRWEATSPPVACRADRRRNPPPHRT